MFSHFIINQIKHHLSPITLTCNLTVYPKKKKKKLSHAQQPNKSGLKLNVALVQILINELKPRTLKKRSRSESWRD